MNGNKFLFNIYNIQLIWFICCVIADIFITAIKSNTYLGAMVSHVSKMTYLMLNKQHLLAKVQSVYLRFTCM